LNAGGSYSRSSGFSLEYSIGESTSISFFKLSDKFSLSTGILQSFTPLVLAIFDFTSNEGRDIIVSPNPAIENIRIKGLLNLPGFLEFHLVDVSGKLKLSEPKSYYANYFEREFNVSTLNNGVYFIHLLYQSVDGENKFAIFKFIKNQ
jgi:hypothetical protein